GLGPEILERIVRAGFGLEHVHHDVAVVEENPAAFFIAFDAQPVVAQLVLEDPIDLFADGVQLPPTGPAHQDKEVEYGGQLPQVEDYDIAAAIFRRYTRGDLGTAKPWGLI